MENVVFIQDFPKLASPSFKSTSELPRFARDICDLLDHMQVPDSVKEELLNYNFDKAKVSIKKFMNSKDVDLYLSSNKTKAHIVASVSGIFEGEDQYNKYGHTRLAEVVKGMYGTELSPDAFPKVEMQVNNRITNCENTLLIHDL